MLRVARVPPARISWREQARDRVAGESARAASAAAKTTLNPDRRRVSLFFRFTCLWISAKSVDNLGLDYRSTMEFNHDRELAI